MAKEFAWLFFFTSANGFDHFLPSSVVPAQGFLKQFKYKIITSLAKIKGISKQDWSFNLDFIRAILYKHLNKSREKQRPSTFIFLLFFF